MVDSAVDFGAGKGRYFRAKIERCNHLTLVDSDTQINRIQKIGLHYTNLRKFAQSRNDTQILNKKQFAKSNQKFGRIFVWNVLPVIPFESVRINILKTLARKLEPDGSLEIAINYRNSEFNKAIRSPACQKYRDGYLIDSLRGSYFLTLIDPERFRGILKALELSIQNEFRIEGSMYFRTVAA